jgi:archaellum biogenesis ATPase FlaH
MSNNSEDEAKLAEVLDQFEEGMAETEELQKLKHENSKKKAILDDDLYSSRIEALNDHKKDLKLAHSANYGTQSQDIVVKIQQENDDYFNAARRPMSFINSCFNKVVPFFRKNLILIGGDTGRGKSTMVANIVYQTITIDNEDGRQLKALLITNEELASDFYNRLTCMKMNWSYTRHSEFTEEQQKVLTKAIKMWSKTVTIIDNYHNDSHGVTTTIEGIKAILDNLIEKKEHYDVIIIDYYQNIIESKRDPTMDPNKVQARLAKMLDQFKNKYPAPIIMMAQMDPPDDTNTPWKQRIKGRKLISDSCTMVMEMIPVFSQYTTRFTVWKSRFNPESIGDDNAFWVGYDRGRFVEITKEFEKKIENMQAKNTSQEIDKAVGQAVKAKEELINE